MKKVLSIAVIAMMLVGAFAFGGAQMVGTASAAEEVSQKMVTVNGQGSITVKPDIAYITIGVETKNDDAQIAQKENAEKMTAVMEAMKKAGVKDDEMKTQSYNIYQTRDWKNGVETAPYYVVNNSLKITTEDIDGLGKLIDAAATSGANNINSIQFGLKDDSALYNQALALAMDNAGGKAKAIFNAMSVKMTTPSKVTETSFGGELLRNAGSMDFAAEAMMKSVSTPIQSGELTVTARVSVEYGY